METAGYCRNGATPTYDVRCSGAIDDYGGFGIEALPTADVERILSAFPRLKMKQQFAETCCRLVKAKPETSYDNFLRDFGERVRCP